MEQFPIAVLLVLCGWIASGTIAGAGQTSPMEKANALFNESRWAEAGVAYQTITASEPKNGTAWENLGECFLQQHKDSEAAVAFEHAIEIPFGRC